ncbi:MAG TPA: sugar ABC transporter permease [Clostridiaceae bacterium]|nr:sugar ABC transporter permease [Clostridiaceae bacterium]
MLFPGVILYAIFFILPFLMAVYYSFTNWDFSTARFIGLENYINIFTNKDMNIGLKNTLIFTAVTAFFKTSLGLLLAIFLNQKLKTANYLKTVVFLPAVINAVAVGIIMSAVLHPELGMLNRFLKFIGLGFLAQYWLTDIRIALYSVCFAEVWKWTGLSMVVFLAGLQAISRDYYEVSDIDGANAWQRFFHVTVPLLMPAINNVTVMNLIGGLKVFDIVIALTNGGPGNATQVLNTVIFRSYSYNLQGEACAGSVVLSLLVAVVAVTAYSIIAKKEVDV